MALLDAGVSRAANPGSLGGTGQTVDWEAVADAPILPVPITLAGGLTPDNVTAAIRTTHAIAVDTASGVESSPGRKDPDLVRRFVEAAKGAFSEQTED
jgi:phosphoribosylanthranilate isomerase